MVRLPSLSRSSQYVPNTDTLFANDMARQLAWLTEQGRAKGYQNVHELAQKDMAEFVRLAAEWRQHQSWRRTLPLLEQLSSLVQSVSARLLPAMRT